MVHVWASEDISRLRGKGFTYLFLSAEILLPRPPSLAETTLICIFS